MAQQQTTAELDHDTIKEKVRLNYDRFKQYYEPDLLKYHTGRFALMYETELIRIYDEMDLAFSAGCDMFGYRGGFSVQEIGAKPVRMPTSLQFGFHS